MFLERAPIGLSYVSTLACQLGFDLAVQCGGHECFTAALDGGVDDQTAIGRKAGAFVRRGIGDRVDRARRQIHDLKLEGTANAGYIGQPFAVRADGGRDVVAASKGHALSVATRCGHFVDLWRAATVADKVDGAAIA